MQEIRWRLRQRQDTSFIVQADHHKYPAEKTAMYWIKRYLIQIDAQTENLTTHPTTTRRSLFQH